MNTEHNSYQCYKFKSTLKNGNSFTYSQSFQHIQTSSSEFKSMYIISLRISGSFCNIFFLKTSWKLVKSHGSAPGIEKVYKVSVTDAENVRRFFSRVSEKCLKNQCFKLREQATLPKLTSDYNI